MQAVQIGRAWSKRGIEKLGIAEDAGYLGGNRSPQHMHRQSCVRRHKSCRVEREKMVAKLAMSIEACKEACVSGCATD